MPNSTRTLGPASVFGCAAAVAMNCVWFLAHFEGVDLAAPTTAALLLFTFIVVLLLAGAKSAGPGAAPGWRIGLLVGLFAGGINLITTLTLIVDTGAGGTPAPGASALKPQVGLILLGFLGLCAVLGAAAGAVGDALAPASDHKFRHWPSRLAGVVAVSFLPLLLVGGLVTSTGAGLSVPDWPGTYGANMFLYPIALMADHRVYIEHSHRLLGATVGLCVLTLTIVVLASERRGFVKAWAIGLLLAVVVQGVLGGLRVTEKSIGLAAAHGVFAQLVFAAAVALAGMLSPMHSSAEPITAEPRDRRRRVFATGLLHAAIFQLVLGATFRHMQHQHVLYTHAAFSLVVVIFALATGFLFIGREAHDRFSRPMRRVGMALVGVVAAQFILGWIAFMVVLGEPRAVPTPDQLAEASPVPLTRAYVTTLHQANGAVLLGLAALARVIAARANKVGTVAIAA